MAIKGILFDKDGTLIEVNKTWVPVYQEMLPKVFNVPMQDVEKLMVMGGYDPVTESFASGSILAGGTSAQIVKLWWPELDDSELRERIRIINEDCAPMARRFLKPLMPLAPIFDALHAQGFRLGIATNDSHSSTRGQIEALDIPHYFDDVIAADTVAVAKPSGQMIARFSDVTGFRPDEIAMVGDNSHDMEEARNGGAGLAIAVLSGNSQHGDIAHMADHVLDSISDLPDLMAKLS